MLALLLATLLSAGPAAPQALPSPPPAGSVQLEGTLADRPDFYRPRCTPDNPTDPDTECDLTTERLAYETNPFEVDAAGEYTLTAEWDGFDGYLLLYRDTFTPGTPLSNLIGTHDDHQGTLRSQIEIELDPGRYVAVSSVYSQSVTPGLFRLTLDGPGAIGMVGEVEGTWATTTNDGEFYRPSCPPGEVSDPVSECTLRASLTPYAAQALSIDRSGLHQVRSLQTADGVVLVYAGAFDPENPLTNLVAYNDDAYDQRSSEVTFTATADERSPTDLPVGHYTIVTTTFYGEAPPLSAETSIRTVRSSATGAGSATMYDLADTRAGDFSAGTVAAARVSCTVPYVSDATAECSEGSQAPHVIVPFELDAGETASLRVAQQFDGVLAVYAGPFDPAQPRQNLYGFNDDGTGGTRSSELEVTGRAGVTWTLVLRPFHTTGGRFAVRAYTASGAGLRFGAPVADEEPPAVSGLSIGPVAPNPSAGHARLTVATSEPGPLRIDVLDALGREVLTAYDGPMGSGSHTVALDTAALAPGVYLARVRAGDAVRTVRFTVSR